ncbi:DCN1-like protein 1 [Lobulomyces angularis]|nr:DCN1-like protein 1 [Lobulomyces angularis]
MGTLHLDGWIQGWEELGVDSIEKFKEKLTEFQEILINKDQFKEFYFFLFDFAKEEDSRNLNLEIAIALWEMLLPPFFKNLNLWIQYLKEEYQRPISRDPWMSLWDFIQQIDSDFSNFDENQSWPTVIDGFVEFARERI